VGIASKKIQPYMELQQRELTRASKLASCAISSIETVKVFNGQESELVRYSSAIQDAARWYLRQALACAIEVGCIHLLTFGMFVQGFWYGGYLVSRGELNAGQVLTTFWACFQATQSIEDIIPQLLVLERGRSSASFLKATVLDIRDSFCLPGRVTKRTPLHCEGDIRFKNVNISLSHLATIPSLSLMIQANPHPPSVACR
jgi:ATP-binding cassette subfamily B (MDR/TAP) protein 1